MAAPLSKIVNRMTLLKDLQTALLVIGQNSKGWSVQLSKAQMKIPPVLNADLERSNKKIRVFEMASAIYSVNEFKQHIANRQMHSIDQDKTEQTQLYLRMGEKHLFFKKWSPFLTIEGRLIALLKDKNKIKNITDGRRKAMIKMAEGIIRIIKPIGLEKPADGLEKDENGLEKKTEALPCPQTLKELLEQAAHVNKDILLLGLLRKPHQTQPGLIVDINKIITRCLNQNKELAPIHFLQQLRLWLLTQDGIFVKWTPHVPE